MGLEKIQRYHWKAYKIPQLLVLSLSPGALHRAPWSFQNVEKSDDLLMDLVQENRHKIPGKAVTEAPNM